MADHSELKKALDGLSKPTGERHWRAPEGFENGLLRVPRDGLPRCDCGGPCRPINCFGSRSYWRCDECHRQYEDAPEGRVDTAADPEAARRAVEAIRNNNGR